MFVSKKMSKSMIKRLTTIAEANSSQTELERFQQRCSFAYGNVNISRLERDLLPLTKRQVAEIAWSQLLSEQRLNEIREWIDSIEE